MRQGQQNRRGRGRNRKGQNPLTRSYESNGPDVKIRGTPAHVAEKYMSLARDAMASGDRVLAENHYQHAEHYNRIIMAYRDQQLGQSQDGSNGRSRSQNEDADQSDDYTDDENEKSNGEVAAIPGGEPQPTARGFDDQPQSDAPAGGDRRAGGRGGRNAAGQRRTRGSGGSRGSNKQSSDAPPATAKTQQGDEAAAPRGRATRFADSDDKPDFLNRPVPVRRPRRSTRTDDAGPERAADASPATSDEG